MKSCEACKHAEWHLTAKGRMHPSGLGECKFVFVMPKLPASMYWHFGYTPSPSQVQINRKTELKGHCVYWAKKA